MKICLATRHRTASFIPLSLLYLKAYLVEREGRRPEDVPILEFDRDTPVDAMVRGMLDADPEVLGLSCYVWNVKDLLAAARRVKEQRPGTRIVLGGPEVGPVAADVLALHPWVDVIVNSEGEVPFAEILRAWSGGGSLGDVKGISFQDGNGIVKTDEARIVDDLSEIPSPHLGRYGDYTGRVICIETQRGCVFRCNFCFYNKDFSIRNRRFDLDRVKEEILFWLNQDVKEIYLMDPVFNLNAARAREICQFIADHNPRRVPLHAEIWAEFVDDEMARAMRDANFHFLEVGLQTTDTTALATVERRLKLQRFIEGIEHLKRYGLYFELQLIFGLPGDTRTAFSKSLNFAMSLDPSALAVYPLMVLPGTELWRKADGLRLAFDPEPPYYATSHLSMDGGDFQYGWQITDACEQLQRSRTARLLARERGLTFAALVDDWIAWQPHHSSDKPDEDVRAFVAAVCKKRQIPLEFYRHFAALEFAS
jgi:radical SAM superfamily enzyme YgiQ (UPF0313 family)